MPFKLLSEAKKMVAGPELRKFYFIVFFQILINILDLVGVALVGALLSLTLNGIQSKKPNQFSEVVLSRFGLLDTTIQTQATILSLIIVLLFVSKSLLNIFLNRFTFRKLALIANSISSRYFYKILNMPNEILKRRSNVQIQFDLVAGINSLFVEIPGNYLLILVDFSLIMILLISLLFLDPFISIFTLLSFSLLALMLNKVLLKRNREIGLKYTRSINSLGVELFSVLALTNELRLAGKLTDYIDQLRTHRLELAESTWRSSFYPTISKYVFETSTIMFAVLLAAIEFLSKNAISALSSIALFMTISSRVAPAILRIQQSTTVISMNKARAKDSLEYFYFIDQYWLQIETEYRIDYPKLIKVADTELINMNCMNYVYPDSEKIVLKNISLKISKGEFVAFVGVSGAGKSSLTKLIIGSDSPTSGTLTINGLTPREFALQNPGRLSYVSQDIHMLNASLLENITFSKVVDKNSVSKIQEMLDEMNLSLLENVTTESLQKDIDVVANLSGGQKQRIGIARALYHNPDILVLDEATSALDAESEKAIHNILRRIHGQVTLIVVAHRLSTIREADKIVILNDGEVVDIGKFEELRDRQPSFAQQLRILGL